MKYNQELKQVEASISKDKKELVKILRGNRYGQLLVDSIITNSKIAGIIRIQRIYES